MKKFWPRLGGGRGRRPLYPLEQLMLFSTEQSSFSCEALILLYQEKFDFLAISTPKIGGNYLIISIGRGRHYIKGKIMTENTYYT